MDQNLGTGPDGYEALSHTSISKLGKERLVSIVAKQKRPRFSRSFWWTEEIREAEESFKKVLLKNFNPPTRRINPPTRRINPPTRRISRDL